MRSYVITECQRLVQTRWPQAATECPKCLQPLVLNGSCSTAKGWKTSYHIIYPWLTFAKTLGRSRGLQTYSVVNLTCFTRPQPENSKALSTLQFTHVIGNFEWVCPGNFPTLHTQRCGFLDTRHCLPSCSRVSHDWNTTPGGSLKTQL